MKKTVFTAVLIVLLSAWAIETAVADGPGMVAHFASLRTGVRIHILKASLPNGKAFPHGGSIGPNKNWKVDGKTMGAAPDGRELPEWVDFEWQEWPRPSPSVPRDPEARQVWKERVDSLASSLPRLTQRVLIRDRVPAEAVDELMQSKRVAKRGELPDKWLWVHFIWTDDGIKFHWSLQLSSPGPGEERILRSGGDKIESP